MTGSPAAFTRRFNAAMRSAAVRMAGNRASASGNENSLIMSMIKRAVCPVSGTLPWRSSRDMGGRCAPFVFQQSLANLLEVFDELPILRLLLPAFAMAKNRRWMNRDEGRRRPVGAHEAPAGLMNAK